MVMMDVKSYAGPGCLTSIEFRKNASSFAVFAEQPDGAATRQGVNLSRFNFTTAALAAGISTVTGDCDSSGGTEMRSQRPTHSASSAISAPPRLTPDLRETSPSGVARRIISPPAQALRGLVLIWTAQFVAASPWL